MDDFDFDYISRHQPKIESTISHRDLRRIPLDNGKHSWLPSGITADLGRLGFLPNELLADVLEQVDLPTLTNFRLVNRMALTVLEAGTVPAYSFIVSEFPALLRAAILANARAWTCLDLYHQLRVLDVVDRDIQINHHHAHDPPPPRRRRLLQGAKWAPRCTTVLRNNSDSSNRNSNNNNNDTKEKNDDDGACQHPAAYLWLPTGKCLCNCCYHAQSPLNSHQVLRHLSLCGILSPGPLRWQSSEEFERCLKDEHIQSILSRIPHSVALPKVFGRWKKKEKKKKQPVARERILAREEEVEERQEGVEEGEREEEEEEEEGRGQNTGQDEDNDDDDDDEPEQDDLVILGDKPPQVEGLGPGARITLWDREAVHARYMPEPRQWTTWGQDLKCTCEWLFIYNYGDGVRWPELPDRTPSTSGQSLCAVRLGLLRARNSEGWPPRKIPIRCRWLKMRQKLYEDWSGNVEGGGD